MSVQHPTASQELLALEVAARRNGSGVSAADLQDEWWLDRLWGRQGANQNSTATLLRGVGASLAITAQSNNTEETELQLRNSVRLGALALVFTGPGWLSGKRPLLRFRFERMALLWGKQELWHTALPELAASKVPFFALIACERSGDQGWLAARGRGGGLALWRLRPPAPRG